MFYNNFFYFFLEVYIIGVFFLILFLLTCWKLLKKSIKLNGLVCSVFLIVLFTSICLYNYLFFIENFYFFENEDFFYFFFKNIVLIFLFIFGIASYNYFNYFKEGYVLPDFYLLLLIFLLVNLVLLSVNDIMLFYVLLELQNLIFFIFAAFVRNRWFVVEAAFRYFLVSGFSTMMFLLSFCLFWGVTGILDFSLYLIFFENMENFGFMYYFFWLALIFFFFSFSLKLGLFPFHWWLVDVFEGVPLLIVFFFMIMPKIFLVFFLIKFFYIFFFFNLNTVMFFYFFFVLGSMLWALIKVLYQFSLIRFLVYSSIFNMSFIYVGLFSSTIFGVISTFIFLMVYLFNTLGLFFFFFFLNFKRIVGVFFFFYIYFFFFFFIYFF